MKKILGVIIVICLVVLVLYFVKRDEDNIIVEEVKKILITVNDRDLVVELEKNSTAQAFYDRLTRESITISTHDNEKMNKVGELNFELPKNDQTTNIKARDLTLSQGNKIALYYDENTYKLTKLGRVTNVDSYELKELLGDGDVSLKFSIKR